MKRITDWIDAAVAGEILIGSDFDGTLATIAQRPEEVRLGRRANHVLAALARAARTHLAILSGRTLEDLAPRLGPLPGIWLSTDHGRVVVDPAGRAHTFDNTRHDGSLSALRERATDLARVFRGANVEVKPYSVALHFRDVPSHKHDALIEMFRMSCIAHHAQPIAGRKVVEGRFGHGDKGIALRHIMTQLPSGTSVVYVGDDTTDQPALAYAYGHPRGLALHVNSDEREPPRMQVHGWLSGPDEWIEILEAVAALRVGRARAMG